MLALEEGDEIGRREEQSIIDLLHARQGYITPAETLAVLRFGSPRSAVGSPLR